MKILISNDDGYLAQGLRTLAKHLQPLAEVQIVAPDRDRSGASHSLTLRNPLYVDYHQDGAISVQGTPTDCVHLALTGLLDYEPDIVISGINHGANMGDDILYSGTVAAAMEGRFLGLPALAVSLAYTTRPEQRYFDTAARVVVDLIAQIQQAPMAVNTIFNINVPNRPYEQIKGYQATRLGHRHKAEPAIATQTPRGHDVYWIGPAGSAEDAGDGTDFAAVAQNAVSVTPLLVDLTHHQYNEPMSQWLTQSFSRHEHCL